MASALTPFLQNGVFERANQDGFLRQLEAAGARIEPVTLGGLVDDPGIPSGHPFRGVMKGVEDLGLLRRDAAALWRYQLPEKMGDASLWSGTWLLNGSTVTFIVENYWPQSFEAAESESRVGRGFLLDEALLLGSVLSIRPSEGFHLTPTKRVSSLDELAQMVERETWPYYRGVEDQHVHEMAVPAYAVGCHDAFHYATWKNFTSDQRKDAVLLYSAVKAFLLERSGPEALKRKETLLDNCLSGPSGLSDFYGDVLTVINGLNGKDHEDFLRRLERVVEKHPRRTQWLRAIGELKNAGKK